MVITGENKLGFKAYYADTDSYGVVWHGAYLRWLEAGRIEFLNDHGISINNLQNFEKIVLPVVNLEIQYKISVKVSDEVIVKTRISELKPHYVIFEQTIEEAASNNTKKRIFVAAKVKCVGINEKSGKLIRTMDNFFRKD